MEGMKQEKALDYDRYLGPFLFEFYAADLASRLELAAGAKILETACGTGDLDGVPA